MRENFFRSIIIVSLISVISIVKISAVSAEALWLPGSGTPPRNGDPAVNYKSAPCRDFSRTKRIKIYKPGDPISAQWLETRDQFGVFQFNLLQVNSATGTDDFVMPVFSDVVDDINGVISGTQYHQFQKNFSLPTRLANGSAINSGDYVLQLVQLATSLNAPADATLNPIFKYYSCSDIRLENTSANDVTAPDNVGDITLVYNSNSLKLDWVNPLSNGVNTGNLVYKVLVLQDNTAAITVTVNQLANKKFTVGDILNQKTRVAYVGNGESFSLNNTVSKDIFFKIFSYDVNGNYSSGINSTGSKIIISVMQGAISDANVLKVNNGNITVSVSVMSSIANEIFQYDWTQDSQSVLVDVDGVANNANFVVDSRVLATGNYTLQLNIKSSTGTITTVKQNLILLDNVLPETPTEPAIAKKIDLGGCSFVGNRAGFDPLLLLLVLISLIVILPKKIWSLIIRHSR